MIDQETINQIQSTSLAERIHLIELLLESLKQDIMRSRTDKTPQVKPFMIRPFNLGKNVQLDRNIIYAERNV